MDPRRVLVVTDVRLAGWALRQALTSAGFAVVTATDTDQALGIVAAGEPFDVLVVSQSLGSQRVAGLLEDVARRWPGVPAIVLAADAVPERIETRAAHVMLEKPYSVFNVVALARGSAVLRPKDDSLAHPVGRVEPAGRADVV